MKKTIAIALLGLMLGIPACKSEPAPPETTPEVEMPADGDAAMGDSSEEAAEPADDDSAGLPSSSAMADVTETAQDAVTLPELTDPAADGEESVSTSTKNRYLEVPARDHRTAGTRAPPAPNYQAVRAPDRDEIRSECVRSRASAPRC